MKKLLTVFVAFALLAGSVFGVDVSVGVGGVASTSLFYATKGSGESDNGTDSMKFGDFQTGSNYILGETGGPGAGDNILDGVSLTFAVGDEDASASVTFVTGGDQITGGTTIGEFVEVDGWVIKGKLGIFDGQFGTDGYGGHAFTGGYNLPFWYDDKVEGNGLGTFGGDYLFAIGIQPSDMFKIAIGTNPLNSWDRDDLGSKSGINAAVILSLMDLADVATIDVFYAISGTNNSALFRSTDKDDAKWDNMFGIYANLGLGALGLQVGFTAEQAAYQSVSIQDPSDATKVKAIVVNSPMYAGIDLNVSFDVNDQLGIYLNNNVSFASVTGSEDDYMIGLFSDAVGKDAKESYFVYVGELGGSFAFTDALSFGLTLTEKLGTGETVAKQGDDTNTSTLTKNYFEAVLKATYTVGPVSLGAGLGLGITSYDMLNKSDASGAKDVTANYSKVEFNIPIIFTVSL